MGNNGPFKKISELVDAIAKADKGLAAGTLGLDGLEGACADARELYERLVVLRHKARESAVSGGQEPRSTAKEAEMAPEEGMRLDTRPAGPSRQTSLIDAIESSEHPEAPATAQEGRSLKVKPKSAPSVAEKLEKAAVTDLEKAITLSHKFWFVAELFNGDRDRFERTLKQWNGLKDLKEANDLLESEVLPKLKKPADAEALAAFKDLLQRRFP